MGVIRKQSLQSSLLFYVGAFLGFLNRILLFTVYLSVDEVGLANILVTNAGLWAQLSAFGFSTMTLRFFPYFADKDRKHHHFLFWLLAIPTLGFLLVSGIIILLKGEILAYFDKSPLLVEYFWYLVPLSIATLYADLLDSYLRSLHKTVVPVLFREVIQRVFVAISIIVYALGWIDFPQFVGLYVGLLCCVTVLMMVYTRWLGHFSLKPIRTWRVKLLMKRLLTFGGFTLLGNVSTIILFNLDSLMLAHYKGMDPVGIYTTCFYVTALIMIPWKAIQKIASPKVAEHWRDNNLKGMSALYQRTSMLNYGIGLTLFLSMALLMEPMFRLLPDQYRAGQYVMLIVGASRVFDMLTGLNGYIMVTSKYFKVDLIMNAVLVATAFMLNRQLIPPYGIEGAAIATGVALFASNLFRIGFLWYKFGLQPFSLPMLWLSVLAILFGGGGWVIFLLVQGVGGSILGFSVFLALFSFSVWKMKLLPDLNTLVSNIVRRIQRA